jgi:hypothetical protein
MSAATRLVKYTPADYVSEIVVPTLREFRDDRRSRRRAYLAAIAVFHIKEHLRQAGERNVERTMRAAGAKSAHDFRVVRAICNGSKHVTTDASHLVPFSAGSDTDRPPAFFGQAVWGVSKFDDLDGGREITVGIARIDIYDACKAVLNEFVAGYPSRLGDCDISDC